MAQTGDSAATCAAPSGSPGARWGVTFAAPKQRRALAPLLRDARLSKDAMSRLVALLRENFVTTTPRAQWPKIAIQRCTNHTVELFAKAPVHPREELAENYRLVIYAESRETAEACARQVSAQAEAALQGGQRQRRGGRRRTFQLSRSSDFAMEGAEHHQCAGGRLDEEVRRRTKPQAALSRGRGFCSCSLACCSR